MSEGRFERGAESDLPRVLISTSTFPSKQDDGQARFVLDLADALSNAYEVMVLAPHAPGALLSERIGRVAVCRFRYFAPSAAERLAYGAGMRHNLATSWLAKAQVPFLLLAQIVATVRIARMRRVSVINAHWLVPQGLTAAVASWITGVPLVLHVHAADVYFLRNLPLGRMIARYVLRRSASVLADGSHVRDSLDELVGFPSGAHLRPMGVHVDRVSATETRSDLIDALPDEFVAFVGRLVEKKGVEFLVRAMPRVREVHRQMHLVVVGSGPLDSALRELARSLQVADNIHFVGAKSHTDAMTVMNHAAVVCVPSIIDSRGETEGMPTVVLEAMAAGARVVGSDVDGIPDVLRDDQNGWLVPPANSDALARGLLAALGGGVRDDAIVARGLETARANDWRVVAEQYGQVLSNAVDGGQHVS